MEFYIHNSYTDVKRGTATEMQCLRDTCSIVEIRMSMRKGDKHPTKKRHITSYYNAELHKIPSGLMGRVLVQFEKNLLEAICFDKRVTGERFVQERNITLPELPVSDADYSYQDKAVVDAICYERGLLHYPTGAGKTVIMAKIIEAIQKKSLVVVPNLQLLSQTYEKFCQYFGSDYIGKFGDDDRSGLVYPICIATQQSLYALKKRDSLQFRMEVSAEFDVLFLDECHHVAIGSGKKRNKDGKWVTKENSANTWWDVAMDIPAYYRYGMTATLHTNDSPNNQFVLESVTSKVISSIGVTELINRKVLCPIDVTMIRLNLEKYKVWKTQWETYTDRIGVKIKQIVEVGAYEANIIENDQRNYLIAQIANKLNEEGRRVLIHVDLVQKHGKLLHYMMPNSVFISGEMKSKNRQKELDAVEKYGKILIGTIFKEGFDMPAIDALIIAGGGKSEKTLIQKVGRVLRISPGKTKAVVYDFYDDDNGSMCERHSQSRHGVYSSESQYNVDIISQKEFVENGLSKKFVHRETVTTP